MYNRKKRYCRGGDGSGIGGGIATGLVQAGADMIIAGRNMERLKKTAEALGRDGGRVVPVFVDMKDGGSIEDLVDRDVEEFEKIDFLFNNAGTVYRVPSEEFPADAWDNVIQINLSGPFYL